MPDARNFHGSTYQQFRSDKHLPIGLCPSPALWTSSALHFVWCAVAVSSVQAQTPNQNQAAPNLAGSASLSVGTTSTTPSTQAAATVTAGGTFQQVLAANSARTSCMLQNTSAHIGYVYWLTTGTPSQTNTMQINTGQPSSLPICPCPGTSCHRCHPAVI
jgi:hypothetical protein